jgi:hypothetical protein
LAPEEDEIMISSQFGAGQMFTGWPADLNTLDILGQTSLIGRAYVCSKPVSTSWRSTIELFQVYVAV